MSRHRIERQNGLLPPSRFLRTSERTGIVHRLPGRMHKANIKILKKAFAPPSPLLGLNSLCTCSPWSVFQDGSDKSVCSPNFLSHTHVCFFLSQYLSSIGIHLYLALDTSTTLFILHYQAKLLRRIPHIYGPETL